MSSGVFKGSLLIKFILIYLLKALFTSSEVAVVWKTIFPAVFGNVTYLQCNISDEESNCLKKTRQWYGGPRHRSLCYNNNCTIFDKYEVIKQSNCLYTLLIRNFSEKDVNCDYTCLYGVSLMRRKLMLDEQNFIYKPHDGDIHEQTTENNETCNLKINVSKIFPIPSCGADLNGEHFTDSFQVSVTKPGFYYAAALQIKLPVSSCGKIYVYCYLGNYKVNITTKKFDNCHLKDLVLTKEIIYKTLESKVNLVCPIETTRDITWSGPPDYIPYAVGTDVYSHVSTLVEIKKTDTDKKSVLIIHRFTEDISGEFRCSDSFHIREFNLVIKRDPSDIAIEDATGQRINTVEGREHTLECSVTSGQPGGNITWSTDGAVVATSRPSSVRYRLIPQRSDNRKLFKCEAFNSEGKKVLESSVQLEVFYIPKITFRPNQTLTVKEGEDTQLMCRNDGNDPDATTVWKRLHKNTIIIQNDELNLKSINRTDAGIYTCRVDTKAGVYEDNAKVVVQYAPTIDIQYSPNERQMKCIPNGLPDRYMFKDWEHTTEYNDHIRFLATTKEGNTATLTFPTNMTGKYHHRDSGIYICRASNNISSSDGMFIMQTYNLNLISLPYFVSSTENTQFGVYFKTAEIEIKFVSVPEYDSYDVYKNGSRFTDFTELVYRNKKLTDNVYDKNVSVKGTIISLQIQIHSLDAYSSYKIVVKNAVGSSHHTIELVSANTPNMPKIIRTVAQQTQFSVLWKPGFDGGYPQRFIVEYKKIGDIYWNYQTTRSSNFIIIGGLQPATKYLIRMFSRNLIDDSNRTEEILIQTDKYAIVETSLSVQSVVILLSVIIILLLVAGMGLYVRRLKQRHRERMELAINIETPEGTYDEIAHYTDIIEVDNLQPSLQENDNSIMLMTNRDIDLVSGDHASTSSDNDRDSSEYIDDGYEQPYTTLVVTDQVKDDHVYLTTKNKSDYENAILFQNVACGNACEFLEEDSLSDKINAHDDHEKRNRNYDVNDFTETNENVPQTFIYPQINKAEYINLSLNQ